MKIIISQLFAILLVPALYGQSTTGKGANKPEFSSINQVGLLTGAAGEAATLQSINGIKVGHWFTGIGAGIHYYGLRSIPLFADVRRTFGNKVNKPFVYADGGISFPWETTNQLQQKGYERSGKKDPFYDLGVGYKLAGKNNRAFLISAGYSYKKMRHQSPMYSFTNWPIQGPSSYETFTNHFRTIVVKMGLQF